MKNIEKLIKEQKVNQHRNYESLLTKRYIINEYGEKGLRFILKEIQNHYDSLIKSYAREVIGNKQEKEFTNSFDAWSLLKVCIEMKHEDKLKKVS
jgi:hypothetical protein